MDYIKVKDKDHLVRDVQTNGIVNVDMESYNKYVETYIKNYNYQKKINKLECDVTQMKDDLNLIKNMLETFIHGSWKN